MPFGIGYGRFTSVAKTIATNPVARAALIGGAAGAAYGGLSDNGSALGGAMKGAAIGAFGARYVAPTMRVMGNVGRGMSFGAHAKTYASTFSGIMRSAIGRDLRSAKFGIKNMISNHAFNPLRGFRGSMA